MTHSPDTLVTGATGFLGRWLLIALTRRGRRVVAVVRSAAERAPELLRFVDARGGNGSLITCVDGDIGRDDLGLTDSLATVRDVYHLAAAFGFGLDPEHARHINVGGTQRVLCWARRLPQLRRFVYLGGYRATHMPEWLASAMSPLDASVRKRLYAELGAYEGSKYEAHLTVRTLARAHEVPLTIVNPSTVIGDSRTGETTQITGLGETVRDLFRGKLPALAGTAQTFVPLVAVDHVAEVLATVPDNEETIGQELCVLDPSTPLLPDLVAKIGKHLGVDVPTRLIPTRWLRRLPKALTGIDAEALSFLTEDRYDTRTADAHAAAMGITMPDFDTTLGAWVTHLAASRFGQTVPPRAARFVSAVGSRTYCVGNPSAADALLLHGIPWEGSSWQGVASRLDFTTASPDLPGLGRSSPAQPGAGFDAWLGELTAERRAPAILMGHSLGTEAAVRYALARPDGVSALVLVSPFFLQKRPSWLLRQPFLTTQVFSNGSQRALQANLVGRQERLRDAVARSHEQLRRRGVARRTAVALADAAQRTRREELRRLLAEVQAPVFILHGEHDPLEHHAPGNIAVTVIEGAGHNPHVSQPAATASAIRAWVRELEKKRSRSAAQVPRARR